MTIDEVDEQFAAGFAEQFAEAWRTPDLAKHEALWSDDIVLTQPMMGTLRGTQACRESFQRLFALVPDLLGDVPHTRRIRCTGSATASMRCSSNSR